jgi:hypothetical protein
MLAFFLIVTLLAGIGYQLRRWFGKQPWYMGVGFVVLLYLPAFVGALFVLSALGTPMDTALRTAPSPVLGGLITGAVYLCGSGGWMPGVPVEQDDATAEGK